MAECLAVNNGKNADQKKKKKEIRIEKNSDIRRVDPCAAPRLRSANRIL